MSIYSLLVITQILDGLATDESVFTEVLVFWRAVDTADLRLLQFVVAQLTREH